MLANCYINPTLPATDLQRARRFYAEKLGLTPQEETSDTLIYRSAGDTALTVFLSGGVASGTHTQAAWVTPDIEAEVAQLKSRGLVFEEYATPSLKTVNSIATLGPDGKGAWFKDSEGNLLVVFQLPGQAHHL